MYTISALLGPYGTGAHAETFTRAARQESTAGQAAAPGASHLLATLAVPKIDEIAA